jgi:hypothetical protein
VFVLVKQNCFNFTYPRPNVLPGAVMKIDSICSVRAGKRTQPRCRSL